MIKQNNKRKKELPRRTAMRRILVMATCALIVLGISPFAFAAPFVSGAAAVTVENPLNNTGVPPANLPVRAIARQGGYNLRFVYTFAETTLVGTGPVGGQAVALTIPNDFPVPSLNPTDPGFVTVAGAALLGTPAISGRTILCYTSSATVGSTITINFGNGNLVMPNRPNRYTFNMQAKLVNSIYAYPNGFQTITPSPQVDVVTNMNPATAIFTPDTANENCAVDVTFQLGAGEARSLFKNDRIRIWFDWSWGVFPEDTILSAAAYPNPSFLGLSVPLNLNKQYVRINGMACTVSPIVSYVDNGGPGAATAQVDIFIPNDIRCTTTTGQAVRVTFDKLAGIVQGDGNPPATPYGRYAKIATITNNGTNWIEPDSIFAPVAARIYKNAGGDYLNSNFYEVKTRISTNNTSPPLVTVTPSLVDQEAQYVIGVNSATCGVYGNFQVGNNGSLTANLDTITIEFPAGTRVPAVISPASILVRLVPGGVDTAVSQAPQIQGNRVTIKTPISIPPAGCLTITFLPSAHIVNPSVGASDYSIKVWTSKEPTQVNTLNYTIDNPGWAIVNVDPNISYSDDNPPGGTCARFHNSAGSTSPGARYTIQFSLSESCRLNINSSQITIRFDPVYANGTVIPAIGPLVPPSSVLVNGVPCTTATIGSSSLNVISPVNLAPKSQVTVTILPSALFRNPDISAETEQYVVRISLPNLVPPDCQPEIVSQSYFIKTEVQNVELINFFPATPIFGGGTFAGGTFVPSVNAITPWMVRFCLGDFGDPLLSLPNLVPGDTITVTFPEGVSIPSLINSNSVLLNIGPPTIGNLIQLIDARVEGQSITARLPATLPLPGVIYENTELTMIFPDVLGIRTPSQPGNYYVTVKTNREATPVPSAYFMIGTVITKDSVTVTPNTSRSIDETCAPFFSEYTIRFKNGLAGALMPGSDNIQIIFPQGFTGFPAIIPPVFSTLPANAVIINGVAVTALVYLPPVPMTGTMVIVPVQDYIAPGSLIEITILKTAGIQNPLLAQTPTIYTFKLNTTREPAWINLNPIEIVSKVCINCSDASQSVHFAGDGTLTSTSILMGTTDGWLFGFMPGDVGVFTPNDTTVTIEFPVGVTVPQLIPAQFVQCFSNAFVIPGGVCGTGATAFKVTVNGQKVTVQFPNVAPPLPGPGIPVYIYFCKEANISAPMVPGNYTAKVWTSKESTPVETCSFSVLARGMTPAIVTPEPSIAGAPNVKYTVEFNLGPFGSLSVGDTVVIDYGWQGGNVAYQTTLAAPGFSGDQIPPMYVTVNGRECILPVNYYNAAALPLPGHGLQFFVKMPVQIPAGGSVKIIFSPNCRIKNPDAWSPDDYKTEAIAPNYSVSIYTNREIRAVESEEYEITNPNSTTRPVIINEPCVAGLPAAYSLSFITPFALTFDQINPALSTAIQIDFPEGFYLPSSMLASAVVINGYQCIVAPTIAGYTVTVVVPTNIRQWEKVTIKFDPSLMLYNPAVPGKYKVYVRVLVTPPPPASVRIYGEFTVCEQRNICRVDITPGGMTTVPLGGTQAFTAKVFDCNGQIINENLDVNWSFSTDAGYISPIRGATITFTAFKRGEGVLLAAATYGNRTLTSTANVIVTGRASSVLINPSGPSTFIKGQCYTYCAQLYDDNNPPHAILSGATYTWQLTAPLGTITPSTGKCVSFCTDKEGIGGVIVSATYEGETVTNRSDFTIMSGINSLAPLPAADLGTIRAGQLSPELMFELRDQNGQPTPALDNITVKVEATSPSGRFSTNKIVWGTTNKIELTIVKGFTRSNSVYFSDMTVGNVTLTAYANNINPTYVKVSFTGPTTQLVFSSESRIAAAGAPSPPLTLTIRDEYGQVNPPSSDITIILSAYKVTDGNVAAAQTATGSFSLSDLSWSPIANQMITLRAGQPSIDFFFKDTVVGTYHIEAKTVFHGTAAQNIVITNPGSVGGTLLVTVDPPIAKLPAKYTIEFRVGAGGLLGAGTGHIFIMFPAGTDIPGLSQAEIKVNNTPCQVLPIIDRAKNTMDIITPVQVAPNTDVRVEIPRITNPMEGAYTLKIWTSVETQPTTSVPYQIGISTVRNLRVTVTPNSVGLPANYLIEFKTGPSGELNIGDNITIQFPVGTVFPASIESRYINVNGVLLQKTPVIQGLQIVVSNPMPIQADSDVTVQIDAKAEVRNPPIPKTDYILKLATKSDAKMVDSQSYEIKQASTLSEVNIQVAPPTVEEKAKYVVSFRLGVNGTLVSGDEIYIQMNDQKLPTSIGAIYVTINGVAPSSDVIVDGKRLKIKLNAGIAAGQPVRVTIEAGAGIRNPAMPGSDYRISVFTSKEPYPVNSEPFLIESSVIATHSVEPSMPNGDHGWYTVVPTITLTSSGGGTLMYKYENDPSYTNYTGPFKITKPSGQVVVYYKARSPSGVESAEKNIVIKIDLEGPQIRITSPQETADCIKVKDTAITIAGQIMDINDVELTINGSLVPVSSGNFSKTVALVQGVNNFTFTAKDYAGNQTSKKVCIDLRNKPPVLVFDEPTFMARVTGIEFPEVSANVHQLKMKLRVKGTTEPGITQIVITPITVQGEAQMVKVGADGKFDQEVVLNAIGGVNELSAEAVDALGNRAQQKLLPVLAVDFKLQANNNISDLNTVPVQLQSAPYITAGRTMVPFRIMAESIGAKVGYELDPVKKTVSLVTFELGQTKIVLYIGRNMATVTVAGVSKSVKLDVPPVIRNGVTMVPFRFVAENLGAKVEWNGTTKTARMTYP